MKVFVTGATGFVGSAVVQELLKSGHQVLGLARSEARAKSLTGLGVEVQRGSLEDLDVLRSAVAATDGVIHTGYIHNFPDFATGARVDRQAVETMTEALAGSNRPFVMTSGTAGVKSEEDTTEVSPRIGTETVAVAMAEHGVRVAVIRLPPSVHGEGDHGFIPVIINTAREKGVSAYVGEGTNRWASVHRLDAAHMFRLALEKAPAGSRIHCVADEGVPTRSIAEVIGRHLNVPVVSVPADKASEHFGWIGGFFSMDIPSTSKRAQQLLDWHPTQLSLLEDLDHDYYYPQPK